MLQQHQYHASDVVVTVAVLPAKNSNEKEWQKMIRKFVNNLNSQTQLSGMCVSQGFTVYQNYTCPVL